MAKPKKGSEPKVEKEKVVISGDTNLHSLIQGKFYKDFGEAGQIMTLEEDVTSSVTEWIPTGSYMLDDWISGGRGLPIGKIVTINGKKASGKSTISANILAAAQRAGAIAVLLDTEYAFDKVRASVIGVDPSNLLISQPAYMELVFQQIEALIEIAKAANKLLVVVWDSIAQTPTKKEVEGEIGEGGHYGEHSKVLSQGYRKIVNLVAHNRVLLFQVNQIKTNINATMYQSDITYIGKNPIDFSSHVMIEIVEGSKIKDSNDNIIGIESNVFISKNRVAPPFKRGQLHILFDRGLHRAWEALEIGKKYNRARRTGSWQEILTTCTVCDGVGDGCTACEKMGSVPDPRFKKFYESQVDDMLADNPGLEQWLVYGTPIPDKTKDEVA